jgi:hypothetical protein
MPALGFRFHGIVRSFHACPLFPEVWKKNFRFQVNLPQNRRPPFRGKLEFKRPTHLNSSQATPKDKL